MVIDQNVAMIVVHRVIVQQVAHMETATHVQVPIDQQVVHMETATRVLHHVQVQIVRHVLLVIAIHVQVPVHLPIAASAVMAHAIHDQVRIVQQVARMAIEIPVHLRVQVPIVQRVVPTVTAILVQAHAHLPIVHVVARRVDRQIDAMTVILDRAIHDPRQINPAEATHTVAIAHAQAMIATPVRLRVTANAVVVQIAPEVASPMIAKNVHAVALAKSA
jgi:hypothetical protein